MSAFHPFRPLHALICGALAEAPGSFGLMALPLSASIADVARLAGLTADVHLGAVMMAGGLVAGLLVMGAGMIDFSRLEQSVVSHALRHMAAVGIAWLGYAIALYLWKDVLLLSGSELGTASIAVGLISACLLAIGGWLGGRLVYTFGAGMKHNQQ
jgi:uncharacterized membrane protein